MGRVQPGRCPRDADPHQADPHDGTRLDRWRSLDRARAMQPNNRSEQTPLAAGVPARSPKMAHAQGTRSSKRNLFKKSVNRQIARNAVQSTTWFVEKKTPSDNLDTKDLIVTDFAVAQVTGSDERAGQGRQQQLREEQRGRQ